ncbi:MAG: hypothetical protein LPK88_07045, partial [Alphaproteobacteria bacterium]|nr:hypothetical protein [Alphaproteobacteria bacterium]
MIPVAEFIAATSHTPPEHRRKASDIIGAVCDMAGVDMQELLGRSRAQPLAAIRQYAMWKVRKETALSLPQIA